jgi:hypothetical protein
VEGLAADGATVCLSGPGFQTRIVQNMTTDLYDSYIAIIFEGVGIIAGQICGFGCVLFGVAG